MSEYKFIDPKRDGSAETELKIAIRPETAVIAHMEYLNWWLTTVLTSPAKQD